MFFVFYKSAFEHMWLKKGWYETLILADYECYENIQENLHNSYSIVKKKSRNIYFMFFIFYKQHLSICGPKNWYTFQ